MEKTLGSIVDAEEHKMKVSQEELKSSLPDKQYTTCFCFLRSAQQYFDSLKVKLFEVTEYIPKII